MKIKNGEMILESWDDVFSNQNISEQKKEEIKKKIVRRTRPYNHYLPIESPGDHMHAEVRILECVDGIQIQDTLYGEEFPDTIRLSIINTDKDSVIVYLDDIPCWG